MKIERKPFLQILFLGICSLPAILTAKASPKPKYRRIEWKKLHDEPVSPGDIWLHKGHDPNLPGEIDPKKEGTYYSIFGGKFESSSNVRHLNTTSWVHYGIPAKEITKEVRDEFCFWRPVGIVDVF